MRDKVEKKHTADGPVRFVVCALPGAIQRIIALASISVGRT